jgi:hypothetical protein
MCATYYARRYADWIAVSSRLWVDQSQYLPIAGHTLADELMRCARREVELRGEFTIRMLGELAERNAHLQTSVVLVDCTTLAAELMRDGCRDLENDVARTSRFLPGVDSGTVALAVSQAISRITDHLLDVTGHRREHL